MTLLRSFARAFTSTPNPAGSLLMNWIGQAGFLFRSATGIVLCIDPYQSNSVERLEGLETRRLWWPSFSFEDLKVDAVLCTHDHLDHVDPDTIPLISAYSPASRFLGPRSAAGHIARMGISADRITTMEPGALHDIGDMTVRSVFARHTEDSIGVILDVAGIRIYITGDTEYCPALFEMKSHEPDVLITCINGKYGNLDAVQACEVAERTGVRLVIPMHYGLIPANTVDPAPFKALCETRGLACAVLTAETNYILSTHRETGIRIGEQ